MKSEALPWDTIKIPSDDISVRLIDNGEKLPLYWGKDSSGRCMFMVEFCSDVSVFYNQNNVSIHGIKIDLRVLKTTGNQGLMLVLEKHIDQDIFYSLCETLINVLSDVSDPSVGISVALSQIKRWKAFMAGKKGRILSVEEVRGLFSELTFMQQMLKESSTELDALDAWQGPESSHQDYIFSNTAVEVKSISGRERNTVKISSEDQLESINNNLFLKVFRLIDMPESKQSLSLNELVAHVAGILKDADAIELFDGKLALAGYVELRAYDKPRFMVADEQTYRVEEGFPRVVRSGLPEGLARVSYEIKLESIKDYMCADKEVWGELNGANYSRVFS
ncbi:PD-(D/E)XK motif protein [Methylophaga sp. OBS3]|uniref:PD-(D/E)XK motif protein n=1 Tax=Methylophaga sp. OBS3 TaxID=2991934 RepID=UPI0022540E7F|nr:PD-(D/E)XK motif protein [Methylophaga sp. OBS3]MCX4190275.1 PD-(D/E)XK motif protein [Methylophaga sp. OBS3]